MTKKYASGVHTLRELASDLQRKAYTDLEQIACSISSQKLSIENFLESAVFEANEVINSIQNSISMQKQLLAFSAQQQEEGLQRTQASAQLISEATDRFFNDLCYHSCKVMSKIHENQTRNHQCISDFETMFKEQAAKEERQATKKIAAILATLTENKTAIYLSGSPSSYSEEQIAELVEELAEYMQPILQLELPTFSKRLRT